MSDEETGIRNLKDHLIAYLRKVKADDTSTVDA